jgi:hypothetical protein
VFWENFPTFYLVEENSMKKFSKQQTWEGRKGSKKEKKNLIRFALGVPSFKVSTFFVSICCCFLYLLSFPSTFLYRFVINFSHLLFLRLNSLETFTLTWSDFAKHFYFSYNFIFSHVSLFSSCSNSTETQATVRVELNFVKFFVRERGKFSL